MHIHRSRLESGFTALPNLLLQDRRLSYTARGLLADLLSRPVGWREDGQQMADTSPQGRAAIAGALRELTRAGYYRVERVRQPDGRLFTETHVYDTPQLAPNAAPPSSGGPRSGRPDGQVKDREKETPSPRPRTAERLEHAEPSPAFREAVAALFRVLRPEPRLRLGAAEALSLAPLVAAWLERGATERDLATALLPGLPSPIHAPVGLLRDRLRRKFPPAAAATAAPPARWHECAKCADPIPEQGICRPCAGLIPRQALVGTGSSATARGAALVRAALRGTWPAVAV